MAFDPNKIQQQEQAAAAAAEQTARTQVAAEQESYAQVRAAVEEEKAFRRGEISIRDIIAPAAFAVSPNFLKLGEKFVRTIFVINYPRYISVGWFAPIINLNETFDIAMFFYRSED